MNREVKDRGTGMRLTERTKKLIPETSHCLHYLTVFMQSSTGSIETVYRWTRTRLRPSSLAPTRDNEPTAQVVHSVAADVSSVCDGEISGCRRTKLLTAEYMTVADCWQGRARVLWHDQPSRRPTRLRNCTTVYTTVMILVKFGAKSKEWTIVNSTTWYFRTQCRPLGLFGEWTSLREREG